MDSNTIRPIETRYADCRFRSRTEARWAVFFDALGIEWHYELEGYQLPSGRKYLPDFWLPLFEAHAEVKGVEEAEDWPLLEELAQATGTTILSLVGIPAATWYAAYAPGWDTHDEDHPFDGDGHEWVDLAMSTCKGRLWWGFCGNERPPDDYLTAVEPAITAVAAARSARFEHGESG